MGMEAALALSQIPIDAAVLATMILRADAESAKARRNKTLATIVLDVPIDALAVRLKEILSREDPAGHRLQSGLAGVIQRWITGPGQTARYYRPCRSMQPGPRLLAAFLSFKGKADFVWCLPDSSLYDSVTVQAVLLASLNNRLPHRLFFEFRARRSADGRLPGLPGSRNTDRGGGPEIILAGRTLPVLESPRVFRVAVNQRVERLLDWSRRSPRRSLCSDETHERNHDFENKLVGAGVGGQ